MLDTPWTVPGYTYVRELGRGAGGRVVLATHDQSGREVAIKHLSAQLYDDPGFNADFRDDARLLTRMDSAQAVRLYDYVETPDGAATVMEYVDGISLRDILGGHGPLAPEPALWVLRNSLLGLGAAHDLGVVHRNLKPSNVLVTPDGGSKLTDFGIVARAGAAGVASGMAGYLAPEQWQGETAGPESDVYAATAAFVESVTGQPPYPVGSAVRLRRQHESAPIPLSGVPEPVTGLVTRGLAKDLADRPPRASVLLVELEAAAVAGYGAGWADRGRRQLARRAGVARLLPPVGAAGAGAAASAVTDTARRRRRTAAALAGAATLALIGGGIVTINQTANNAARTPAVGSELVPAPLAGGPPEDKPPAGPEPAGPPMAGSPLQLPAGVALATAAPADGRVAQHRPVPAAPGAQPSPAPPADQPRRFRPRHNRQDGPPRHSPRRGPRSAPAADESNSAPSGTVRKFRAASADDGNRGDRERRRSGRAGSDWARDNGNSNGSNGNGSQNNGGQNGRDRRA